MAKIHRGWYVVLIAVLMGVFTIACEPEQQSTSTENEKATQAENQEKLASTQRAEGMDYSPTRDNLIKWADKWEEQGKLSYVYFFNSSGELGYFIFEGLPSSYCASLTPPQKIETKDWASVDAHVMPAPALDGAYYSGSNCTQFFGYEAGTGNYFEFTVGGDFNYFLSESPLTELDMKPIGDTTEEEAGSLGN